MIEIRVSGSMKGVVSEILALAGNFQAAMEEDKTREMMEECLSQSIMLGDAPKKRGRRTVKEEVAQPIPIPIPIPIPLPLPVVPIDAYLDVEEVKPVESLAVGFDDVCAVAVQIVEHYGPSEEDKVRGTENMRRWLKTANVTRLRDLQEKDYAPLLAYAKNNGWLV